VNPQESCPSNAAQHLHVHAAARAMSIRAGAAAITHEWRRESPPVDPTRWVRAGRRRPARAERSLAPPWVGADRRWRRATAFDRPAGRIVGARVSAPIEVPQDIVERVRALCQALPEVTVRVDHSLTRARSAAQSFDIRGRSFCLLVAVEDPTGKPKPLLVLRADPDDREALLSIGKPFFRPRAGRDRIGVLLAGDTDWEEIRELVTESYRLLAPKKLTALLDS
jgi:predicted DNA-binding protein (MmcQ/YjbR family)